MITKEWCRDVMYDLPGSGPLPRQYAAVEIALHWIYNNLQNPQEWFEQVVIRCHRKYLIKHGIDFGQEKGRKPYNLMGHIWNTPRGYHGDGDLLQKMYDCLGVSEYESVYTKTLWDHYFCARPEMLSLQFRRKMFEEQLEQFIDNGARSLVDLGCGNGSFANYAYDRFKERLPTWNVLGIDNDMLPTNPWNSGGPLFIKENVLKYVPERQYDIVYSGGLFDYFNDKLFRRMLRRTLMYEPKFIVIGNIEQSEKTKAFLGCMGWKLFDRTRWDLLQLTVGIFEPEQVEVRSDFTGHQHFLKVTL
jgi:SAM-dependent methyltransferase